MFQKLLILTLIITLLGCSIPNLGFNVIPEEHFKVKIHWMGHAGFLIQTERTRIYINPYLVPIGSTKGDAILISYSAGDLCDLTAINTLSKDDSIIIAPPECNARLGRTNTISFDIGKTYMVDDFRIEVVDAYLINKTVNKGEGAGFIITVNNTRIYYAGMTDLVPEIETIRGINVAIVPIAGGDVTMDMQDAVILLQLLNATYNVPMYYGGQTGTAQDAGREFKELARSQGVNVTLLSNQDLTIT